MLLASVRQSTSTAMIATKLRISILRRCVADLAGGQQLCREVAVLLGAQVAPLTCTQGPKVPGFSGTAKPSAPESKVTSSWPSAA